MIWILFDIFKFEELIPRVLLVAHFIADFLFWLFINYFERGVLKWLGLKQEAHYSHCIFKSYSVCKNIVAAISVPSLAIS